MAKQPTEPQNDHTQYSGVSRRRVLKGATAAGLFGTVPWSIGRVRAVTGDTDLSIDKWEDPLPIPSVLTPSSQKGGVDHYDISIEPATQQVLSDTGATAGLQTPVWTYEGTFPGPSIVAKPGRTVTVNWMNNLPGDDQHLLSVDHRIHGAEDDRPDVRIVTHVHGADTAPVNDGYPDAWGSPSGITDGDSPVPYSQVKEYPNEQEPATMWYHDHAIGITRLNVYAGLAGFYLLRDPQENSLPSGMYEVPIVFQDRSFDDDGTLAYPPGDNEEFEAEFFGDVPVVNGKTYPYVEVEPRSYRFRLLNGSNGRAFNMRLRNETGTGVPLLRQIGVDLGFMPAPVSIGPGGDMASLTLNGAERADVIVDFAGFEGQTFTVTNDAETPYTGANDGTDMPELLQIRVGTTVTEPDDTVRLGSFLKTIRKRYPRETAPFAGTRYMTLDTGSVTHNGTELDTHFLNNALWDDPAAVEYVDIDTSEDWVLANTTGDAHPIHLHLVDFDVVERQFFAAGDVDNPDEGTFNYARNAGEDPAVVDYLGASHPVPPNEVGPKDTVTVYPNEAVTIRPSFEDFTGHYVWHCHILEHEDQEMMLPYVVQ